MADYDDNTTDEQDEDRKPNWRRELEAKARRADELEKKLAAMERKEAFRDVGLDLSKPGVGYFVKGYDGELTAEAIKAAAIEAGFLSEQPAPSNTSTDAPHPAQAALDGITEAAGSPSQVGADFRAEAEKAYDEGGMEAMLDVVQKFGVPVTTRQ
jgi:hypothetical protein